MTQQQEHEHYKVIQIDKPYHATALDDGWLCIKYLDGGEESLSTFADISKGDRIMWGNAIRTHSISEPDNITRTSQLPKIIPPLPEGDTNDLEVWKEYWIKHDAAIRREERERVLEAIRVFRGKDRSNVSWYVRWYEEESFLESLRGEQR